MLVAVERVDAMHRDIVVEQALPKVTGKLKLLV